MTADQLFSLANMIALAGWIILGGSVIARRDWWRDELCGRWLPLAFSAVYLALILFFFGKAEGGFGSLAYVQKLFASPWVALAGWVHYLAFDLFMGSMIARRIMQEGAPRLLLAGLLPLTFLFGPIGYLAFEATRTLWRKS